MKDALKNLRIGVLMGGKSAEREISLKTGKAVLNALTGMGYSAFGFDLDGDFTENLKKIDVCFNALHGTYGEDGRVQGALDLLNTPYTGSGTAASAIAMDKLRAKIIFGYYGLKTPPFFSITKGEYINSINKNGADKDKSKCNDDGNSNGGGSGMAQEAALKIKSERFAPPYFIKPNSSGSSIGCAIVNSTGEEFEKALNNAFQYDDEVLIERYIKGREIQFAVAFNNPLGCVEVKPKDAFYSYNAKYTKGQTQYLINPEMSGDDYAACEYAAVTAHRAMGCRGVSRTDIILSEGDAYVLEVNTLPGLTELSLVPMIAESKGISFNELIENIIEDAAAKK